MKFFISGSFFISKTEIKFPRYYQSSGRNFEMDQIYPVLIVITICKKRD